MGYKYAVALGEERPGIGKEINRNNEVYKLQGNRNPFVDYPGLEQLVWGDKQNVAFDYDNYDATAPNPDPDPDPNPDPDPEPDPDPTPDPVGDTQIYKVVSSTADLQAGTGYLIVCEEAQDGLKVAMAASGSDVRSYAEVSVSNGTITTLVNEEGKPRQIILGGTSGAYTLYDAVEKSICRLRKTIINSILRPMLRRTMRSGVSVSAERRQNCQ